ncbi:Pentapeptide repeat [Rivularia sp. IAM M-261]|nr:Pentapeptide repeat [Rivularia sp. IAM M-261]
MTKIKQLKKLLDKSGNIFESEAKLSKASFELAVALGLLNSSINPVTARISFVGFTKKGLKLYQNKIRKQLDIAEWVEIAFTLAYLESFEALVQRNDWLKVKISEMVSYQELFYKYQNLKDYPDISKESNQLRDETQYEIKLWQDKIKNAVNKIELINYNNKLIKEALKNFSESSLGSALTNLISIYLEQTELDTHIISIITGWVTWETQKLVESLLCDEQENFFAQAKVYKTTTQENKINQKFKSIESYLAKHICTSQNESWQVFDKVKIPDIYIPLKCHLLNSNGKKKEHLQSVDLKTWAFEQLTDPNRNNRVIFIQAESGRGKTVFCKMFASWVQKHLHPIWTPILIRLQDIDTFDVDIENILRTAIKEDFVQHNDDWLTDCHTRFLFILDGFDELRLKEKNSGSIEKFIREIGNYQEECQTRTNLGHRFLVTGKKSALHSIEQFMPNNLERVEIALMDNRLQEQWLNKWGKLVGQDKAKAFQDFLQLENCPHIWKLSREPLSLHLLAVMHRDGKLVFKMFEGVSSSVRAKILIYQAILNSVLIQVQENNYSVSNKLNINDLRRIFTEAGLCAIQSGKEIISITMIEERLKGSAINKKLDKAGWHPLKGYSENLLNNAFIVYKLQLLPDSETNEGYIKFVHKSFSEFLYAKRLAESLRKWTQVNLFSKDQQPLITDNQLAEEVYDLFYYSGLTPEIVEYLIALLDYDYNQINLIDTLFKRLKHFYTYWCKGRFINAYPQNFPPNKILHTKALSFSGLREIDIYTGLNVMILLSELYRYAQAQDALKDKIIFYPCGQKDSDYFEDDLFFCIISYSNSIDAHTFLDTLGYFLNNAQLSGAQLSNVNLSSIQFRGANLSDVNFSDANLSFADLSGANLSSTDLNNANLSHANLSNANLDGANLSNANLSNANLSNANLSNAKLNHAKLTYTDLRSANLYAASCYEVNFSGATLCSATLNYARLKGANCNHTDFSYADLTNTNLTNAQNLTTQQVKAASNWDKAEYSPEFLQAITNSNEIE